MAVIYIPIAVVQSCVFSLGTEGYECRGGLGCTGVSHLVRERSSVYTEYTNTQRAGLRTMAVGPLRSEQCTYYCTSQTFEYYKDVETHTSFITVIHCALWGHNIIYKNVKRNWRICRICVTFCYVRYINVSMYVMRLRYGRAWNLFIPVAQYQILMRYPSTESVYSLRNTNFLGRIWKILALHINKQSNSFQYALNDA